LEPEELAGTAELTKEPKARAGIRTNLEIDFRVLSIETKYQTKFSMGSKCSVCRRFLDLNVSFDTKMARKWQKPRRMAGFYLESNAVV
jgi:hypothetical protein